MLQSHAISKNLTVVDSLNNVLKTAIESENDALIHQVKLELIDYYFSKGDFNSVDSIYNHYPEDALIEADLLSQAKYYTTKVKYYGINKDLKNASRCVEKAIELNMKLGDTSRLMVNYANKGNLNLMSESYSQAIEDYSKSLEFAFVKKAKDKQALLFSNMSSLYFQLGKYDEGIASANDAIQISQELGDKNQEASAYNNLCLNLYKQDSVDSDSLLNILHKTLEINKEIGNNNGVIRATNNIGTVMYKVGNPGAISYLKAAEKLNKSIRSPINLESNYLSQARYYQLNNANEQSIDYYRKVLSIQNLENRGRARCYEGLCKTHISLNKNRKAKLYLDSFLIYNDSLLQNASHSDIPSNIAEYKNRIYKDSLEFLVLDKEIAEVRASRYRVSILALLMGVLLTILLATRVYSAYRIQRKVSEDLLFENLELSEINDNLKAKLDRLNLRMLSEKEKSTFQFKHLDKIVILELSNILYLKAEQEGCRIYTNSASYWTNLTLKSIELNLPKKLFFRIHRGTIINIFHVDWVNHSSLKLNDDTELKIGRTYKNNIRNAVSD